MAPHSWFNLAHIRGMVRGSVSARLGSGSDCALDRQWRGWQHAPANHANRDSTRVGRGRRQTAGGPSVSVVRGEDGSTGPSIMRPGTAPPDGAVAVGAESCTSHLVRRRIADRRQQRARLLVGSVAGGRRQVGLAAREHSPRRALGQSSVSGIWQKACPVLVCTQSLSSLTTPAGGCACPWHFLKREF